jgi:hypothetical protein
MNGGDIPDDPETVPSGSYLYRRIHPDWYVSVGEDFRVSSQAFQDKEGSMSVALGVILDERGLKPEDVLEAFENYGLLRFSVAFIRSLHLGVIHSPTPAEPWHGEVYGKKTGGVRNKLVANGQWVRRPTIPPP